MSEPEPLNPYLILSPGTQVVVLTEVRGPDGKCVHPRGAVGVVVGSPTDYWHSYRIQFPDAFEAMFRRQELAVLSQYKGGGVIRSGVVAHDRDPLSEYDLYTHVIYRCVVGSRAYGLDDTESDNDRRGVYLPPAELHWSLYGVPEQLENPETEEVYWEAAKFVSLALKANPNVLECLYTPLIEHAAPLIQELLEMRHRLLSKLVYQTYNGYVMSQFKKLRSDSRNKGQVKWKHVMHLLRLLISGVTVLEEGFVPVRVEEHRQRLLSVKRGEADFETCEAWRLELHARFDRAVERTTLPERPDYAAANDWLVRARRSMVSEKGRT